MTFLMTLMLMQLGVSRGDWVSGRTLPVGAIQGGRDSRGTNLYICRASQNERTVCGKAVFGSSGSNGVCYVPYYRREYRHSNFEILTSDPSTSHDLYHWVRGYKWGKVPSNAVSCSSGVHVGRYYTKHYGIQVGKIEGNSLWYSYDGREHRERKDYEVLTKQSRSVVSYEMTNVKYDLKLAAEDLEPRPVSVGVAYKTNDSPRQMVSSYELTFDTTTTRSWSRTKSHSLEVGVTLSVTAEVPTVSVSSELYLGTTSTWSYSTEESVSETTSHSINEQVSLPPDSKVKIEVLAKRDHVNIPYEADLETKYSDGSRKMTKISGTYDGVEMTSFETKTTAK